MTLTRVKEYVKAYLIEDMATLYAYSLLNDCI